jgi:hypothetical protein
MEDEPYLGLRIVVLGEPIPPVLYGLCKKRLHGDRIFSVIFARRFEGLTRDKISDRARERTWLQV